mmetsp:Transcript_29761/g.28936  ORF Transcript_29761/g.28936 Transcript_29761/m.28936 type:complete len:107 (-) Transcript_29761:20-340(-)
MNNKSKEAKEDELLGQVTVLGDQVESLKEIIYSKDKELRSYYDKMQVQKSNYESEISILQRQNVDLESQLIEYISGVRQNPFQNQSSPQISFSSMTHESMKSLPHK